MGYVYDKPIHYIVLNDGENTFDMKKLEQLIALYDKVEHSKEPGVCVTIGTHEKFFSTGFSLPWWMKDIQLNPMIS